MPAQSKLEEVKSQMASLMDDSRVGTHAMAGIDNDLVPILNEMITMWSVNDLIDQHPVTRKLFNWLSNPQCSADEFFYVVGPLWMQVWEENEQIQDSPTFKEYPGCCPCLAKVASEALVARCPILNGAWEYVAWQVLKLMRKKAHNPDCNWVYSYEFNTWLIHVLGNPDLCPNPYLRIELIALLFGSEFMNEEQNKTLIFESVMSACMGLDVEYAYECYNESDFYKLRLGYIYLILAHIIEENENDFDQRLTETEELLGLTHLLKVTVKFFELHRQTGYAHVGYLLSHTARCIIHFKRTCQMPQLIDVTASCIMEIVEHTVQLIKEHMHGNVSYWYIESIMKGYEHFLAIMTTEDILRSSSTLGQLIIHKYQIRLGDIRNELENFDLHLFPTIYNIIYTFELTV